MSFFCVVGGACSGGGTGGSGGAGGKTASGGGHGQGGSGGQATGGASAGGAGGRPAAAGGAAAGMMGGGGQGGRGDSGAGGAAGAGAGSGGAGGAAGHASGGGTAGTGGRGGAAGGAGGRGGGTAGHGAGGIGGGGASTGAGGAGSGGAGGAPATCPSGTASDFVNAGLPCPSEQTCAADRLGRAWSPPVRIDDGTACATTTVQVAIAASGAGLVAWGDGSPSRVRARRFTGAGTGWSSVEDAGAGWGATLRLARASTGDAMLVSTDAHHVRARASVQGAAWTPIADVSGALAGDGTADLAMDKTGAAMAVWIQDAPAYGQATWTAAGGWTTPQVAGTDYYQITVTAHPNGGFSLAGLGGGVIYHKGYLPDGTFESGVVHTTSTGSDDPTHGSLALLIGPSLQPCLTWIVPSTAANPANLEFDCYLAAGRWDIARDVDNKAATGARPLLAQSADTKTLVTTWPRAEGYTPRSAATAISNGSQVGPIYFGGDLAVGANDLQALAMDDAGNAVIVFGTPGVLDTQPVRAVRYFAADGIWEQVTVPLFSATGASSLTALAAAMTPTGQALVVYSLQAANGGAQVYAQTLR